MKFKKNVAEIDGKRFFYWEKNPDQKGTIVLLHGFPGNHMGLIDLADYLGDNYRIIIPDLPACGLSEDLKEGHNLKNYAKWVDDFLESLLIRQAVIVGHSFGSRVALFFSSNYPEKVKRLILITPVLKVDGFIAKIASLYYRIGGILPAYLQKAWISSKFTKKLGDDILFKSSGKVLHKKIIGRDVAELKKINQQVIIGLFDEFYKSKSISLAKGIRVESLVIASDKDEIATLKSVKLLANQLDSAELKIMKNSGHFVPLERPLATAKIIKSWLENFPNT